MKITITNRSGQSAELTFQHPTDAFRRPDDHEILAWLWRQFNRIDETELISVMRMAMPSLSVGDTVNIDGSRYLCEPLGWTTLQPEIT